MRSDDRSVNPGSDSGPAVPKETLDVRAEKEALAVAWAQENLARIVREVQVMTARIQNPDTNASERDCARRERESMLARIRAMRRLL